MATDKPTPVQNEKLNDGEFSATHVDAILNAEKANASGQPEHMVPHVLTQPPTLEETAQRTPSDPKIELTEADCYDQLGYCFPSWRKWTIIVVIFLVQTSMNFNTSLYSNAVTGISEEYGVSAQAARCGAMIFLVLYAFGCELWAPWSEELGRKPILQLSLFSSSTSGRSLSPWPPTLAPSLSAVPWVVCPPPVAPSPWV